MVRHGQPHTRDLDVRGIESGIDVCQLPQCSREQCSSGKEHERHPDLSDNQTFAHAVLTMTAAASASFHPGYSPVPATNFAKPAQDQIKSTLTTPAQERRPVREC